MKMVKSILFSLLVLGVVISFTSCSNNDPAPVALAAITFKDLNADYAPQVLVPGQRPTRPTQKNKYTFFSFKTGQLVVNSDSASTKWDIGFQGTNIVFNGGSSGPGVGGAIVQSGIFDEISEAPTDGYIQDNKTTRQFAVSSSPFIQGVTMTTNNWWLNSGTPESTIVSPIAGRVIIVKTADGRYAKMEILSFYKGAPAKVDNINDLDRHYTFRYIYQPGNTNTF
jgi:hypothetical protein